MTTAESYWRKTGAKFMGSDEEFEQVYTECAHSMPLTDEGGYFNSFYCMQDWKKCDFNCSKHLKIDSDFEQFVTHLNNNLEGNKL